MSMSDVEQYLLELMNRARLDPVGEAARMGIDLNAGLKAGQIAAVPKQVLVSNTLLDAAATKHSLWMLGADSFSHVGANGTLGGARIKLEGYSAGVWAESLALKQVISGQSLVTLVETMNREMFLDPGQRLALMNNLLREAGVSLEAGVFTQSGNNFNVEAMTINLAATGTTRYLTGVAYGDSNANGFYSVGEGQANVVFGAGGLNASTAPAGGYALVGGNSAALAVTGQSGAMRFSATVDMSLGNVKLDLVSGSTFYTSGSIVLGTGVNNALLLGVGGLNATGNAAGNVLTGNAGINVLRGLQGNDVMTGFAGTDTMDGGWGNDRLTGGKGADVMTGGLGADVFIFTAGDGDDRITDFSMAGGDKLRLDDSLWGGTVLKAAGVMAQFATRGVGEVVLDFGDGDIVHLVGLTTVANLGTVIEIF